MSIGVNYLREHVPADSRIHYAVLDSGGRAPNVVQAKATVRCSIRAPKRVDMLKLVARVKMVAAGAAMMTEMQVTSRIVSAMSEILENPFLNKLLHQQMEHVAPAVFDSDDRAYAARIQATLSKEDIESAYLIAGVPMSDASLCDFIVPLEARGIAMLGSSDVGDVSWVVPFAQVGYATQAIRTPGHTWQITAQGKSKAAHKGMDQVAKVLAATPIELITDPASLSAAKADFARSTTTAPYASPLPDDVTPALPRATGY